MNEQAKTPAEKPRVGHPIKDPPSKNEGGAPGEGITIRKCAALGEFHACVELQRDVWGEADLEIEPVTMFVVAYITGGQVLGAFAGDKLVGYTLAVVGFRQGGMYLHSHQTAVRAEHRDRGIGRMLKLFQRDEALARGIRLVEWTFDPLEMKNAHFNLNRLGAICRRYLPNLYGVTTSPLHRGIDTDRLVAEWQLDSPRVIAAIQDLAAAAASNAPAMIEVPAEGELLKQDAKRTQEVQARLREEFTKWFARGYAAVGVRREGRGAAYLLAPWSDF
jgi:predicted GNAT superfamily acetyltransferase